MYPPGCVIHVPGDGHEVEAMRGEAKLLSKLPSPPLHPVGRVVGWMPIASTFPRPDPGPVPVGEPLDLRELDWHRQERRRATEPGHFEQLAIDRELVMDCLRHYNSMHPGDEYVPAAGNVTRQYQFDNGTCWIHGNFVARRKRSACFSFLPGSRTLFFFELASNNGFDGVVTCTPLDEPVTEAYSVLGIRLWWSTRRNGGLDCICKTCHRRMDVTHPDLSRTFACGHKEVKRVCKMCYLRSNVLHPPPGEFAFANHDPHFGLLKLTTIRTMGLVVT